MEKEILKGIKIINLGLFLEEEKALIASDLHLGYETSLRKQGVAIPKFNLKEIKEILEKMFKETGKLNKMIINGDLKHEFGEISEQEWREVIDLFLFLEKYTQEVIVIAGNHDVFLEPVMKKAGLKLVKEGIYFSKQKIFIAHGDSVPESREFKKAKTIIIGHDHCAVTLQEGPKKEKFKCFIKGKFKGKTLIAMPSIFSGTTGQDVLSEELLSPMLQQNLRNFEAWVIEDKHYYFGKLKNLQ